MATTASHTFLKAFPGPRGRPDLKNAPGKSGQIAFRYPIYKHGRRACEDRWSTACSQDFLLLVTCLGQWLACFSAAAVTHHLSHTIHNANQSQVPNLHLSSLFRTRRYQQPDQASTADRCILRTALTRFPRTTASCRPGPESVPAGAGYSCGLNFRWLTSAPYRFIGFRAMEVTKPYRFIGCGAMEVPKPYTFIGFGAMDATPYKWC